MTSFHLSEHALFAVRAGAWLGGGALIGAFYFLTLRWNVKMLVLGRAWLFATTLQLGRFALLAGMLAVIASRFGALPLVLAAAGILRREWPPCDGESRRDRVAHSRDGDQSFQAMVITDHDGLVSVITIVWNAQACRDRS